MLIITLQKLFPHVNFKLIFFSFLHSLIYYFIFNFKENSPFGSFFPLTQMCYPLFGLWKASLKCDIIWIVSEMLVVEERKAEDTQTMEWRLFFFFFFLCALPTSPSYPLSISLFPPILPIPLPPASPPPNYPAVVVEVEAAEGDWLWNIKHERSPRV